MTDRLKRGEIRCPTCGVITQRTANSIVNIRYDQFYVCQCGAKVNVPGEKDEQ